MARSLYPTGGYGRYAFSRQLWGASEHLYDQIKVFIPAWTRTTIHRTYVQTDHKTNRHKLHISVASFAPYLLPTARRIVLWEAWWCTARWGREVLCWTPPFCFLEEVLSSCRPPSRLLVRKWVLPVMLKFASSNSCLEKITLSVAFSGLCQESCVKLVITCHLYAWTLTQDNPKLELKWHPMYV
jgi:hypothetical protein